MPYNGVSFDDDRERNSKVTFTSQRVATGMAGWLMRKGIAQDESQANMILLGISIVIFIISGFFFWTNMSSSGVRGGYQHVPPLEVPLEKAVTR